MQRFARVHQPLDFGPYVWRQLAVRLFKQRQGSVRIVEHPRPPSLHLLRTDRFRVEVLVAGDLGERVVQSGYAATERRQLGKIEGMGSAFGLRSFLRERMPQRPVKVIERESPRIALV